MADEHVHCQKRFAESAMTDEDGEALEAIEEPLLGSARGEEGEPSLHASVTGPVLSICTAAFGAGSVRSRIARAAAIRIFVGCFLLLRTRTK